MKRKNIFSLSAGLVYILSSASMVFAGSVSPAAYEGDVGLTQTISVNKTVTVDPTDIENVLNETTTTVDNKYDILFLADNTGSMGNAIGNVQTNAQSLLEQLSTTYNDIQFGVARYYGDPKEQLVRVNNPGSADETVTRSWNYSHSSYNSSGRKRYHYTYTLSGMGINETSNRVYSRYYGNEINYYYELDPNAATKAYELQEGVNGGSVDDAISAINNWQASGGGDLPEANLFALHQAATSGAATSDGLATAYNSNWRPDAKKIIVWFGDASSHEYTVDKAEAIQALNDNDVTVVAINASNTTTSLTSGINSNSQASSIAEATNGEYAAVFSSNLTDSMLTLIGDAVSNITTQTYVPGTVNLEFESTGDTSGLTVTYTCTDPLGCENVGGSESRNFRMDVTGNIPGTYNFDTVVTDIPGAIGANTINVSGYAD